MNHRDQLRQRMDVATEAWQKSTDAHMAFGRGLPGETKAWSGEMEMGDGEIIFVDPESDETHRMPPPPNRQEENIKLYKPSDQVRNMFAAGTLSKTAQDYLDADLMHQVDMRGGGGNGFIEQEALRQARQFGPDGGGGGGGVA